MRRLLVGNCSTTSMYTLADPDEPLEAEFEIAVAKVLSCSYPGYQCVVFGGRFRYDDRMYKPDLALVARDYSHWFVIEVELASHSFDQHVLPQAKAFRYGEPQADCGGILARELAITQSQADTLLRFVPRSVAVIVNRPDTPWQSALKAHDVQILTVSIFRTSGGSEAVSIDGALEAVEEHLGFGEYSVTDRSLRFPRSVRLPLGEVMIDDPGGAASLWRVTQSTAATWLTKDVGAPSLPHGALIQIVRTFGGRLSLRPPEVRS